MTPLALLLALWAGSSDPASACDLLAADEVRAVQQTAVTGRKPSEYQRRGLRFSQCVFATGDYVHSVSLSLITGSGEEGARGYWNDTFHPKTARASRRKPPRPVQGAWDEAFWSGEARAGALYVLAGDTVLRVSVGGVADEDERLRRTKSLVETALRKLRTKNLELRRQN